MDARLSSKIPNRLFKFHEWMKISGQQVPEIFAKDLKKDLWFCQILEIFIFRMHWKKIIAILSTVLRSHRSKHAKIFDSIGRKLPTFDVNWQWKELDIFREWCLPDVSEDSYRKLPFPCSAVDDIPKMFMHRDFHCRNLLVRDDGSLGIIDFGSHAWPINLRPRLTFT